MVLNVLFNCFQVPVPVVLQLFTTGGFRTGSGRNNNNTNNNHTVNNNNNNYYY